MNQIKTGLWAKELNGTISYSGSLKLPDGTECWANLYPNEKSKENSPDFQLYIKEKGIKPQANSNTPC